MYSVGEKGYFIRRHFINHDILKKTSNKNKKYDKISKLGSKEINKEQDDFDNLIKNKIIFNKEINLIKKILNKRIENKSCENKRQIKLIKGKIFNNSYSINNFERTSINNTDKTNDFSISSFSNTNYNSHKFSNTFINSNSNSKEKNKKRRSVLKLNLSSSKKKLVKFKDSLKELNKYTDELGLTKESERQSYINNKEKRIIFENQTQNEFIKPKRKLTLFNSTSQLNNYLIKDYNFTENNLNSSELNKKIEIAELSYENINREKRRKTYNQVKNLYVKNSESENFYYNLIHNEKKKEGYYSESDMRKIKKEYYSSIAEEKLKKYLKVFEKIRNLNHKGYNKINHKTGVEYNNLERIIMIKKIQKKYLSNNYHYMKEKIENFQRDQDKIYMALRKFNPINILKKKLKVSTINEFKSVNGVYFGIPV